MIREPGIQLAVSVIHSQVPGHASSFRGVRLSHLWGEGQGTIGLKPSTGGASINLPSSLS